VQRDLLGVKEEHGGKVSLIYTVNLEIRGAILTPS